MRTPGKSTLLDLIAGVVAPQSGTLDTGETLVVGYVAQHPPPVRGDLRLIDYMRSVADDRPARAAGLAEGDTPEVLLEKVSGKVAQGWRERCAHVCWDV